MYNSSIAKLGNLINKFNMEDDYEFELSIAHGNAHFVDGKDMSFQPVFTRADKDIYYNKQKMKEQNKKREEQEKKQEEQ